MKEISLAVTARSSVGKGPARRERMDGNIPAVVYGPEVPPVSLAVDEKAFRAAMKNVSGSTLINLDMNGKTSKVIVREIQRDPVTSRIIHLDFYAVSMTKPISISIPVRFVGTPRGVKTDGGIMQTTMRDLEISCLPSKIPEFVEIDVSDLGIGDSVHVRDLSIPDVQILSELRRTVVVISAPTVIKAEEVEEEEVAAEEEGEAAEAAADEEKTEGEEQKDQKAEGKTKDKKPEGKTKDKK